MTMKRLAVLGLLLMTGMAALAQQPAEWRPNLADDNKAATYDDTVRFILSTINDGGANHFYLSQDADTAAQMRKDKNFYGLEFITFGANSNSHCSIAWSGLTSKSRISSAGQIQPTYRGLTS